MNPGQGESIPQQPAERIPIPQSNSSKSIALWKKVSFLLLALIIAVGVFGGSYYVGSNQRQQAVFDFYPSHAVTAPRGVKMLPSPTQDPMADWNTYVDSQYHFSIKYPANFIKPRVGSTPDGLYAVLFTDNDGTHSVFTANEFGINVIPNPKRLGIMEYLKTVEFQHDLPEWHNIDNAHPITLQNSISAIRFEGIMGGAGGYGPVVFIPFDSYIVKINGGSSGSPVNKTIFNQAITTFKFTQ